MNTRGNSLLIAFYFFIIAIYPFIHQISNEGLLPLITKIAAFIFLLLFFIKYFKQLVTSKNDFLNITLYLTILYLLFSLTIFSIFSQHNAFDIVKEILYSIIPIFFFLFARYFSEKEINSFFVVLMISILFVMILGVLELFDFPFPKSIEYALDKKGKGNFISYYSPIIMGYVSQLMFALVLFNIIKINLFNKSLLLVFFLFISIMTLQRSSYLGICISIIVYFLFISKSNIGLSFLISGLFSGILYLIVNMDFSKALGIDLSLYFIEEITNFNYQNVMSDRSSQAIISNVDNTFNIIFGEGFSKFSPNNRQTIRMMPDTSYHRIFNELGIIGGVLFVTPFMIMMKKILLNRDWFMVYFLFFTLIAFYFNRVIWAIPLNFVIYSILGISQNSNYKLKQITF